MVFRKKQGTDLKILSKQSFEIIKTLTINHLKIKYKRTTLGFLWSFLNPLLSVGVISLVFASIMGMKYSEFVIIFFPAFLAWNFFANSINGGTMSIVNNESLIRKTPINLMIFPLVNVAINFVEFVLTSIAFIVILVLIGYEPSYHIIYLPISIVLIFLISVGLSLLVSVISTFLRDVGYLISVFLQLWFYLSPVLYPKDFIEGKHWLVDIFMTINPMVYFIEMFRNPISYHKPLSFELIMIGIVLAASSLALGIYIFNKYRYKLVYRL